MRFLFVDRIVELSLGESIKGIKHVTRDDFYLSTNEQGHQCFIPSLIGETLGQLAAWHVMWHNEFSFRPVAGVVASGILHRPAYVGETLLLEAFIDNLDDRSVQYHGVAKIGDELVFSLEGALGPLLPMREFISPTAVRQQFDEIFRPGDWSLVKRSSTPLRAAQLPGKCTVLSAPFMRFDNILFCENSISMVAEKRITRAALYFLDHFPNKPVLPMTVLLECKLNLAYEFVVRAGLALTYQVKEFRKIKMNEFVQPGDRLLCYVKIKQHTDEHLILTYRSEVDEKRVCVAEVVLIPKSV